MDFQKVKLFTLSLLTAALFYGTTQPVEVTLTDATESLSITVSDEFLHGTTFQNIAKLGTSEVKSDGTILLKLPFSLQLLPIIKVLLINQWIFKDQNLDEKNLKKAFVALLSTPKYAQLEPQLMAEALSACDFFNLSKTLVGALVKKLVSITKGELDLTHTHLPVDILRLLFQKSYLNYNAQPLMPKAFQQVGFDCEKLRLKGRLKVKVSLFNDCSWVVVLENQLIDKIKSLDFLEDFNSIFLKSFNYTPLKLRTIKILNLSNNLLETLPSDFFDNLSNLEILLLNNNRLTAFSLTTSGINTKLHILMLQNNKLSSLDKKLLGMCLNLNQLCLDNNPIDTIDEDSLQYCPQLRDLTLSYNGTNLTRKFFHNSLNLETLKLEAPNLSELPESIARLVKLKYLLVSADKLATDALPYYIKQAIEDANKKYDEFAYNATTPSEAETNNNKQDVQSNKDLPEYWNGLPRMEDVD